MLAQYEISRKTVHLLSLLIPVVTYYSLPAAQIILILFIIFYSFSESRKVAGKTFFTHRLFLKMQRGGELTRRANAPLFLALGIFVAITFFSWKAAFVGIYMAGFCDTLAGVCGKKWGKTKVPFFSRKTYAGSFAFLVSALPVAFIFLPPSKAIVISLVGAFLESLPFKDWDNLTVPIVVSFLAAQFIF